MIITLHQRRREKRKAKGRPENWIRIGEYVRKEGE